MPRGNKYFSVTTVIGLLIATTSSISSSLAFVPRVPSTHHRSGGSSVVVATSMTASGSSSTESSTQSSCAVIANPPPTRCRSGVIFDIDGTLADSWKLGYDATVVVLEKNGLGHVEMNEDIYHAHCVYPTPERLARHAGLTPGDDGFARVGEDLGKQFDDFYVELVSPETCAFYPGIMDTIRGFPPETKVGALTNACAAYGHAVLRANDGDADSNFALYDRFSTVHGADSVPAAKPSPEGLWQCAKEMGLEPSQCIYVGDAPGDGRAARAAGMVAVGVLWGSNSEQKLRRADTFDYLCHSVEDLRGLLPQLA